MPQPKEGQVLVKLIYSGFCSSQYGEIQGIKGKDNYLPHSLGHEACGVVQKVGKKVSKIKKNDLVVLHWMKAKGLESKNTLSKEEQEFIDSNKPSIGRAFIDPRNRNIINI